MDEAAGVVEAAEAGTQPAEAALVLEEPRRRQQVGGIQPSEAPR